MYTLSYTGGSLLFLAPLLLSLAQKVNDLVAYLKQFDASGKKAP